MTRRMLWMEMESPCSCGRRWGTWGLPCPWTLHQCRLMRWNPEGFTLQLAPMSEVADSLLLCIAGLTPLQSYYRPSLHGCAYAPYMHHDIYHVSSGPYMSRHGQLQLWQELGSAVGHLDTAACWQWDFKAFTVAMASAQCGSIPITKMAKL